MTMASTATAADSPAAADEPDVAGWKSFLQAYSRGDFVPNVVPSRPSSSLSSPTSPPPADTFASEPPYSSIHITDETARHVRDYCTLKDHLPPPRSPYEAFREQLLQEYDILGPVQTGNIQAAVDIVAAFFPKAMCTFTLFRNSRQTIFAIGGSRALIDRFGLQTDTELAPQTSLCGHSVLLEDQILFSPRMAEDWRFRSNPYTLVGICSYIGSSVSLNCDPLESDSPSPARNGDTKLPNSLGIGAINIMFVDEPHEFLTGQERMMVTNITRMLMDQLRATWEGHIRTKEARARKVVTDLIEEGFEGGHRVSEGPMRMALKFPELVRSALDKLIAVTELSGAAVLDLRGLSTMPGKQELVLDTTSQYPISVIASTPAGTLQSISSPSSLLSFLNNAEAQAVYNTPDISGLEEFLVPDIRAHFLIPFFSLSQPVFLLVGVSQHIPISSSTPNIARSIGSILLSNIVQTRVQDADAAKTAFLSSISHELRTPLYGLLSGVELAQKDLRDGNAVTAAGLLETAQRCGHTLSHILNDVLDFARPTEGSKAEEETRADLVEVVKHAARMCIVQFGEKTEAPKVMLECERRMVMLDEAKYHRIIINGLTNAFKFCSSGTITLSISYADHLITRITDTGIGFDMKTLPRLLEPFTKQDQHTPGAGLGLHITKRLAESLGGTLSLRSEVGKGTTFEVILPMRVEASQGAVTEILQEARVPAASQPRILRGLSRIALEDQREKLRVLIVDDNAVCLKILHTALKRGPVPVDCAQATSGEEAVRIFEALNPELVITDISMPGMDGVEAARQMREIQVQKGWKRCIIYALTGLGSSDPRLKSVAIQGDAALDGWLVKGLDQMKAVRRIVGEMEVERQRSRGGESM